MQTVPLLGHFRSMRKCCFIHIYEFTPPRLALASVLAPLRGLPERLMEPFFPQYWRISFHGGNICAREISWSKESCVQVSYLVTWQLLQLESRLKPPKLMPFAAGNSLESGLNSPALAGNQSCSPSNTIASASIAAGRAASAPPRRGSSRRWR